MERVTARWTIRQAKTLKAAIISGSIASIAASLSQKRKIRVFIALI
jgi:hypothetical protein